ncbi:flavanone 3-dioxygenase 3 [Cornus florida]|uniref:flavanone 3-dioxygenase 3 n=1 Tax=Cornus florida TaxID=4283 RepID=UPI00289E91EB|nr:flavanone 3-dioxygenase 3 [Cornus florida]
MAEKRVIPADTFTSVMSLAKMGVPLLPEQFVLPPSQRPNPSLSLQPFIALPTIDVSSLNHPSRRSRVVDEVRVACKELGFFQVINHGIPPSVTHGALDSAAEFFNLPIEEKMQLFSENVHEPVRYSTSLNHDKDKVRFWRDFIKHYSNPISTWIDRWPSNPPCYKENMGTYAKALQVLQKQLIEVVFESLGLHNDYLHEDIEEGSQVMAVNFYPVCPEPNLVLGLPPHTDYGTLTILLQSCPGLDIMDHDKKWHPIPANEGTLIVQLGDQMEVMSNGKYKSVIHQATVNAEKKRFSIASLHSLGLQKKVGPAMELVNEKNPACYKEGSFGGFLDHILKNDLTAKEKYIDTLKNKP